MDKLKAIFKAMGNYVAAFFGADTTEQIDAVQIYETLDYLFDDNLKYMFDIDEIFK